MKMAEKEVKMSSPRRRVVVSSVIYIQYMGMAFCMSIFGPSLLHLALLVNSDIKALGSIYGLCGGGFIVGALLNGVLIDRVNRYLILSAPAVLFGILSLMIPWAGSLLAYTIIYVSLFVFLGLLNTASQVCLLGIWRNTRFSGPTYQALHGIWSFGSIMAPLIISPFLVPLPDHIGTNNITISGELQNGNVSENTTNICDYKSNLSCIAGQDGYFDGIGFTRAGYMVISSLVIVSGVVMGIIWCRLTPGNVRQTITRMQEKHIKDNNKMFFKICLILFTVVMVVFYVITEEITRNYIAVIAIKGFNWDVHLGAWLTSVFYAGMFIGRLASIPLSSIVHPWIMLASNFCLVVTSYILMLLADHMSDIVLWLSALLAGLGMSSTFASVVGQVSSYVHVTGFIMALFTIGCSLGAVIGNIISAHVFQIFFHKGIIIICMIAVFMEVILYFMLIILLKCYYKPAAGNENNREDVEHRVPLKASEK